MSVMPEGRDQRETDHCLPTPPNPRLSLPRPGLPSSWVTADSPWMKSERNREQGRADFKARNLTPECPWEQVLSLGVWEIPSSSRCLSTEASRGWWFPRGQVLLDSSSPYSHLDPAPCQPACWHCPERATLALLCCFSGDAQHGHARLRPWEAGTGELRPTAWPRSLVLGEAQQEACLSACFLLVSFVPGKTEQKSSTLMKLKGGTCVLKVQSKASQDKVPGPCPHGAALASTQRLCNRERAEGTCCLGISLHPVMAPLTKLRPELWTTLAPTTGPWVSHRVESTGAGVESWEAASWLEPSWMRPAGRIKRRGEGAQGSSRSAPWWLKAALAHPQEPRLLFSC